MVFITAADGSEPRLLDVHVFVEVLNNGTEGEQDALLESISEATPDELEPFMQYKHGRAESTILMMLFATTTNRKSLRLARLLVRKGADYKARDVNGSTILMIAAHECVGTTDITMLCYFLQELDYTDTMINAQNIHGWTALHFAGGSPHAVELLLQHGADPIIHD